MEPPFISLDSVTYEVSLCFIVGRILIVKADNDILHKTV